MCVYYMRLKTSRHTKVIITYKYKEVEARSAILK